MDLFRCNLRYCLFTTAILGAQRMIWRKAVILKTVGCCLSLGMLSALVAGQTLTRQANDAKPVTLRILVLDGKTGKPERGREVHIYELASRNSSGKLIGKGLTNENGTYSAISEYPAQIAVSVKGRFLCTGRDMGTSVRNLSDILTHGVVEANKCNLAMSHSAEPGTLILFVRRESLAEVLDW
jgi:hypothetical protein